MCLMETLSQRQRMVQTKDLLEKGYKEIYEEKCAQAWCFADQDLEAGEDIDDEKWYDSEEEEEEE